MVGLWSLFIFLTIPLAPMIGALVAERWGRDLFTYLVLVTIAAALITLVYRAVRTGLMTFRGSYFWLTLVAATFAGYTLLLGGKSPEESIHFIQYGVLGVLVFRALAIKRHDASIFFSAAAICGIIGTIDETIQWLVPQRLWDLRDIWINFLAAALVQVAIALGLKPAFLAPRPSRANLRFLCRLLVAAAVILGTNLLNTPPRIAWYAERIPGLEYLLVNESVMLEYGFLYDDPDIGVFRSRLAPDALRAADRERAAEAAAILNRFRDRSDYKTFLSLYTPVNDPFVHEARVHLFSRDANFEIAMEKKAHGEKYAGNLNDAYRQNQILEKYFPHTLRSSDSEWPIEKRTLAQKHLRHDKRFESFVSRHLITRISETQVILFCALLVLGFVLLAKHFKDP
jgi:hypothetical protein